MTMKLSALILFMMPMITHRCNAQEKTSVRIETVMHFVHDLRNGRSNHEIFTDYLSSRGHFTNDTVRSAANGFTDLLRASVQSVRPKDVSVYAYQTQPESAKKLKDIDDPSIVAEHVPLEFTLDTMGHKSTEVDITDLYVLKLPDERIFVLFDKEDKMITYFGMQWRHRVSLVEF